MVMVTRPALLAGTASIAACTVVYLPVPSEATVGSADDVGVGVGVGVGAEPTRLKAICIRATSEQVSCTIGLPPAVEPPWSLTHWELAALTTSYLPGVADEAMNDQSWLLCAEPQPHCCSWVPDVVEAPGTSMHRPLLTLTRLNLPLPATAFHS